MNMKSKYIKIGGIVLFIICVIGVILTAKYNKAEPVMATPETTETQESIAESTSVPKTESEIESTEESITETETDLETAVTETEEALYTVIPIDPVKLYATANVNMRDLPDVSGNKIGSLSYGEEVTATGTVKEFNGIACYWLEVRTSKGLTGFVNGGYLVEERPNTNTTNSQTGQSGQTSQTGNGQTDNSNSGLTDQTNTGTAGNSGTATPPVNTIPPVNNNQSGLSGDGWTEDPAEIEDLFSGATGGYKEEVEGPGRTLNWQ
ncbi:MAG: SH3 domain-containing protein [Eisenbergiella sp.]